MADDTPLDKRRKLGRELRRFRQRAGLTGPELAKAMGTTQSRVSRIENSVVKPKISDVGSWADATSASAREREDLLKLAEGALTELSEWQAVLKGSLAGRQRELMATDKVAREIRHFQPYLVPGPFQSPSYARAAITGSNLTGEIDVDQAVADRMERGRRIMKSRSPRYDAILMEAGIRWRPKGCPPGTRREQWERLLEFADSSHISVRVIPLDAELVVAPMIGFVMVTLKDPDEPPVVRMETPAIHMAFSGADQVAAFELTWKRMADAALNPEDSIRLIQQLIRTEGASKDGQ
jgi:transcriptional regulator with XRE-family HTH domain